MYVKYTRVLSNWQYLTAYRPTIHDYLVNGTCVLCSVRVCKILDLEKYTVNYHNQHFYL